MGKSAEYFDEVMLGSAKAGLARHSAEVELGLGKNVEINVTGKLVGIEIERITGIMLYTVELRDSNGVFLSTARVSEEMIVR